MVTQDVSGCLEERIGQRGLSASTLGRLLDRLTPALAAMKEGIGNGAMPLLCVPDWTDDIEPAREALDRLSAGARTLVFFGTGG
ncbi:MAG: glucose-6-phosphate isomerase, partial [Hyphomicrobiales bacterium]